MKNQSTFALSFEKKTIVSFEDSNNDNSKMGKIDTSWATSRFNY